MHHLPPAPVFQQQPIPVSTFPVWAFPPVLQDVTYYLQDGGKIPVELIANSVLGTVSEICQSHFDVHNAYTNMSEPPSLYIMTLADSGTGKSTISKMLRKPFDKMKAELAEAFQEKLSDYERSYAVWSPKHQALESNLRLAVKKGLCTDDAEAELQQHVDAKPVKPVIPSLVYNDVSVAALIAGLSEYPSGSLISDEASNLFEYCVKNNLAFFNKAWDGDTYEHYRHQQPTHSFKPKLTVHLMLQSPLFLNVMKKHGDKASSSGFLSRFLFTNIPPNSSFGMGYRHHHRDETALTRFHSQVSKLLTQQKQQIISGESTKKTLKLSTEAIDFWEGQRTYWTSLPQSNPNYRCIDYMLQKANTNTLRIAAMLHYFVDQEADIISLEVVKNASAIMNWYLNHALSWFYQFTSECKFQQDAHELALWIHRKFIDNNNVPFKKNEIIKYGPNKFRRSDKLEPLLDSIVAAGNFIYCKPSPHSAVYITWHMGNGYYAPVILPPDNS
ncbi:hypothetical protein ABIE17_002304 [Lelliottia nimipressuralis]|uniref:YfjI family protein n=1 Tax=Lelliottia nimipressuralis TaxID=69220 RepID=UPI003D245B14